MKSTWSRLISGGLVIVMLVLLIALAMPMDRGEPENPISGIIESFPPAIAGAAADETEPKETQPPETTVPDETEPAESTEPTVPETAPTIPDVTIPTNDPTAPTVPEPAPNPTEEPIPDPTAPPAPTQPAEDSDPVIMTDLSNREITFSQLEQDELPFYAYIRGGSSELYLRVNLRNSEYTGNGIYLNPDGVNYTAKLTKGRNYFTLYMWDSTHICSYVQFVITYSADKATEDNPVQGEHPPTIVTNLDGGITEIQNDSFCLYVTARDYLGNPIFANGIKVCMDGKVIPASNGWTDPEYDLFFEAPIDSDTSEHIITVTAWDGEGNSRFVSYHVTYHFAGDGTVIGNVRIIIDATTIGLGWLDEYECEIHKNVPASVYVLQMLDDCGFFAYYSGEPDSQFYLSRIARADVARNAAIPPELLEKLRVDGINFSGSSSRDSIGEFDYTTASGWMYSINGALYPSRGMDSTYLHDGDTLYIRYTLAYGKDIGGSSNQGVLSTYCGTWLNGSYQEHHQYDDGAVTVEPTCTEQGVFAYTCKVANCGHQKTQPREALGHDEKLTDHLDPTDAADGFDLFTCTRCGQERKVILPKTGTDEPTEPKPTDPEPTEPKPTEPEPTEPKPTEPEPTEPEPTEPEPTEPEPTEPEPTEPGPTEPPEARPISAWVLLPCVPLGLKSRKIQKNGASKHE